MKKKIETGDIIQIPLPKGLGYGYALYIDLLKILPDPTLPDLIKVYNYKSVNEVQDLSTVTNNDFLLNPLLVAGLPPTLKKGIWKIVGNKEVFGKDLEIPHFKQFGPPWVNEEKEAKEWYYIANADISKKIKVEHKNVKHLEPFRASGTGVIETKIAMAFLMQKNKKVEDYFELKEYYEKATYEKLKNMPLYYELPDYMKGRVLED